LLIVINDSECSLAICDATDDKIGFRYKLHHNLTQDLKTGLSYNPLNYISKINPFNYIGSATNNTKEEYNQYIDNFNKVLSKLLEKSNIKLTNIDEYAIAGKSYLMEMLNKNMKDKMNDQKQFDCDPKLILLCGTTYYSAMLNKSLRYIKIDDKYVYSIKFELVRKGKHSKKDNIAVKIKDIPFQTRLKFSNVDNNDLPIKLCIYEGKELATSYSINTLPKIKNTYNIWDHLYVDVHTNDFGDFAVSASVQTNYKKDSTSTVELITNKFGLNDDELDSEGKKIKDLLKKSEDMKKESEQKSMANQKKNELIELWTKKKDEIEGNKDIRPLIKKKILAEYNESINYMENKNLDLNSIQNREQTLKKSLDLLQNK
jgi:hypothetical protein